MKIVTHPRVSRFGNPLVVCCAILLALTAVTGRGAESDLLKKLMEENAALRNENTRLRQSQSVAPVSPAPATATSSIAALS